MKRFKCISFIFALFMFMVINVKAEVVKVDTADEIIQAFANGGEIELAGNINLGEFTGSKLVVPADKDVVLDLNGFTISGKSNDEKANARLIENNGSLVINDSSAEATGKLTMDDTRKSLWKYSYGSYTIQNSGTLVINNGTIENVGTTDVPYPIDNNSTSRDVITTINGGNIVSEKAAIRAYCNSTSNENRIIINGGNITGGTSAVWVSQVNEAANKGYLEVNGGNLYGKKYNGIYITVFNASTFTNISTKITGGIIKNNSVSSATLMYEPWDDVSDLANANVDLEITGGTFINENAEGRAFVQPEFLDIPVTYRNIVGGTYSSDVREYIAESVVSKMINNMYVVGKENDIKVEEPTLGKVSVDKTNAIVGETITVIATPNNGYEVANIKVLDAKGEEITVTNNKFVMPDGGVTVEAEFTRLIKTDDIPVVDFTEEVKEVTIGVKDKETVQEILYETIINDETLFEKIELERVNVEIEIDQIESSKISEETVKKMEEKAGKATIANYFDISIAVKNTSGTINEQINELTKEIELMIALPEELRNNNNDINRKYYVVREHVVDSESQVDLLEAKLSADGKHLTFKTDKFSTYALAYEDVKKANNPDTSDNINLYVTLGVISLMGVGISANVLKKRYLKK